MSDERRYSEAELRAIIERAAQRQESSRRAQEASEDGLTLAELQQVGAASGIDPAHIATAAAELANPETATKPATLMGIPGVVRRTRFIASRVSDPEWERIVSELRREFDSSGIPSEVGRVREWTTQVRRKSSAAVRVALEPVEGGTEVVIEQTLRRSALPFTLLSAGYLLVALILSVLALNGTFGEAGAFAPALFFASFAALMFGGSQVGFRLHARRQDERFERALDRIELIARDGAVTEPMAEAAPPLDLDALPDEEPAQAATRSRTRS